MSHDCLSQDGPGNGVPKDHVMSFTFAMKILLVQSRIIRSHMIGGVLSLLLFQSPTQEAGMNSWHVVGTCSPDNLSVSQGKEGEATVMDCHRYVLRGPTILVLGELAA